MAAKSKIAAKIGKNQHVRQNSPKAKTINKESNMAAKKKEDKLAKININ